ncbi:MAG TPA: hypothetical protein VMV94_09130 [Phycisphaerae bacterium]|nr:hypothetical protein [Phycisphaerae bacterium]
MDPIKRLILVALPLGLFAFPGCSGIGPETVAPSRFDYTAAIGDSWKQQMLINLVKLRYGDAPVFLDVASVISQFQIGGVINWNGTFNNQSSSNIHTLGATGDFANPVTATANWGGTFGEPFLSSSQAFGVTGTYADRPTITYIPLSGEKFTRTLMKPIQPPSVLSLVEAGYPVDFVLRICVHSINGIRNRYGGAARAHPADPEFYPLLERLRRIQNSGAIGLRVQKTSEMEGVVMSLRGKLDASTEEDVTFVRKTLGLDPAEYEFRIVYGSIPKDNRELAILTRSVLEILVDSASCIEVPAAHVEEKRVNPTLSEETAQGTPVVPLLSIHSSRCRPGDAFLAVPYRNYWFWIDDRDTRSKSVFSSLMFIFSLTDTESKQAAPIVTIPSG